MASLRKIKSELKHSIPKKLKKVMSQNNTEIKPAPKPDKGILDASIKTKQAAIGNNEIVKK